MTPRSKKIEKGPVMDSRTGKKGTSNPGAKLGGRLAREVRTVSCMIELYCRNNHVVPPPDEPGAVHPCDECAELAAYARERVVRCPFGDEKPTCARCVVHCYRKDMRARIRLVMRYAGPRMVLHHPVLALQHVLDGLKGPRR